MLSFLAAYKYTTPARADTITKPSKKRFCGAFSMMGSHLHTCGLVKTQSPLFVAPQKELQHL